MGIFKNKDETPVVDEQEFDSTDEAVKAHDEQEVDETPEQAPEAEVLDSVEQGNKESNESVNPDGSDTGTFVGDPLQKEGETAQEYNERVPVAVQPVLDGPKLSYLGEVL